MPEGPSIVILKEEVQHFTNQKVIAAEGNSSIDKDRLVGQTVIAFKSWGKNFLICFDGFSLRVHLMLFGTYLINNRKEAQLRLGLQFNNGELNLYTCQIDVVEGDINNYYDWSADVMNDNWNAKLAMKKLKENPDVMVCDALLDQEIFGGVGNIIKNEVLYRIFLHPESKLENIPKEKLEEVISQASAYAFDFLKWKKENVLKQHWLAHTKKICLRCDLPMHKEVTGKKRRNSYFCPNCQVLY